MKGASVQPFRECGSLTVPVAGCVADGVEVILGAQDQAIANEGWGGQRHCAEVVGIEQFEFIASADHERPASFVHTTGICNRPTFHSLLNGSICSNDAIMVGAFPEGSADSSSV